MTQIWAKYSEKLKDPKWQKLRLQILERDNWTCQKCFDDESMLVVHHKYYENNKDPWEYPLEAFITLCEYCHELERNERPLLEQELLLSLKKQGFLYEDIINLLEGFRYLEHQQSPRITALVLFWVLETPEIMRTLEKDFKKHHPERLE